MKGIENVRGVKNHSPRMFTLDFIEAKKIIEKMAMRKFLFVFLYTMMNKISAVRVVHIAGRNLYIKIRFVKEDNIIKITWNPISRLFGPVRKIPCFSFIA